MAEILDACCGGRMWWWDKAHPLAVYMDKREAPRGSVGELTGRPEWNPSWECAPDVLGDFRAMPFEDGAFRLVVFDPPHVVREKQPPEGINGLKYGALGDLDELRDGFAECWRVLAPGGTLVFKWAGALDRVEPYFPAAPIVGTRSPRGGQTRWLIFYKPLRDDPLGLDAGIPQHGSGNERRMTRLCDSGHGHGMAREPGLTHSRDRGPAQSHKVAARLWWALLPYIGFHCDKENGLWRWWMRPAYWLWTLVGKLPGSDPFKPMEPIVCTCDYCQGVPGAEFTP